MNMGMSFLAMLILFGGNALPDFMASPPRDLAALLAPEAVLQQMQVETEDDAALIALLRGEEPPEGPDGAALEQAIKDLASADFAVRQAAAETLREAGPAAKPLLQQATRSEDPEVRLSAGEILGELMMQEQKARLQGDLAYVKKLYAIRLLEQRKSQEALPALRQVAEGEDITLADAAGQAIAAISGEEATQEMEPLADRLRGFVPAHAGFVVLTRLPRPTKDAEVKTLDDYLAPLLQQANAAMPGMMDPEDQAEVMSEAKNGLLEVIAAAGNIRVDGAMLILSDDLGLNDNAYGALVVKGFWDAKRVRSAFQKATNAVREIAGQQVYGGRREPAVCVPDGNTFLVTFGDAEDAGHMARFLSAIATPPEQLPGHVTPAFELMTETKGLAAAGALSKGQRAEIKAEMQKELQREQQRAPMDAEDQLEKAGAEFFLGLADVERYEGVAAPGEKLLIVAVAADEEAAARLQGQAVAVKTALQGMVAEGAAHMPPPMANIMRQWLEGWTTEAEGNRLNVRFDINALMQGMMGARMHVPARPRPVPAAPMPVEDEAVPMQMEQE